jgi:hypothetical protein
VVIGADGHRSTVRAVGAPTTRLLGRYRAGGQRSPLGALSAVGAAVLVFGVLGEEPGEAAVRTGEQPGGPYVFVKGIRAALNLEAGQHGGVTDLVWDDVKCFFDPDLMGSLPDVRVPDASVEDWQAVLDLVAEKGWKCRYSEGERVLPVPRAEAVLSRSTDVECPDLRVWPTADVLAIFRFHADDEVDFDVDLRELQGQARLDVFCGFLREIGRRLGKPVLMDPEGDSGHPVLGFDVEADRVVVLAEPLVR